MPSETKLRVYKELLEERRELPLSEFVREIGVSTATAWRALKHLIESNEVESVGAGRSTSYSLVRRYEQTIRVPLGLESWDINDYVNSPESLRKPVGYHQTFLDSYIPNESRYLPQPITERLAQVGAMRSGDETQPGLKRRIERLTIDLAYGSSRLEGISTSYLDTERLLSLGRTSVSPKERGDVAMLLNHRSAIQYILDNRQDGATLVPLAFNRPTIQDMHTLLLSGIHPDEEEVGRPRLREVAIAGSVYNPLSIPAQTSNTLDRVLEKCDEIVDPFEQSFFALIHLAYLQPFGDGNKRTSRMMANIPLLKADLCPISFIALPKRAYTAGILGVYELNRIELMRDVFISSYEQSAHRLHQDRNRTVVPHLLELQYREEIAEFVRDIVRNAEDGYYAAGVKDKIDEFDELNRIQKDDLYHIILEKARKTPLSALRQYALSADEYRAWDQLRPCYLNSEAILVATREPAR